MGHLGKGNAHVSEHFVFQNASPVMEEKSFE
jgi:hypothetical protein